MRLGDKVGREVVGNFVGLGVGSADGLVLGAGLGISDGLVLGIGVAGCSVGLGEGVKVGSTGLAVGLGVGSAEGIDVGEGDGCPSVPTSSTANSSIRTLHWNIHGDGNRSSFTN